MNLKQSFTNDINTALGSKEMKISAVAVDVIADSVVKKAEIYAIEQKIEAIRPFMFYNNGAGIEAARQVRLLEEEYVRVTGRNYDKYDRLTTFRF